MIIQFEDKIFRKAGIAIGEYSWIEVNEIYDATTS